MKILSIILLLFVCNTTNVVCQTYNEFTQQALEQYNNKNYKESSKSWDKAFKVHKGYASDYYNSACTNALAGNNNKALDHIGNAIENGWNDITWLKKDTDFSSLKETQEWSNFLNNIPKLQQEYLSSINVEMKDKLENLRMKDQTMRLLLPDAEKRFGRQSDEYNWFRNELMPRNDSIVLNEIVAVIENDGWLGITEVGELANQTLWLVIQHAPLDIQKKYLPLLKISVDKGESKARYLAFLQDRILMREDKKQIYGTQSLWNEEKKKNVIWPIADYKTVNQRRKEVGLESVEDYAKNSGFVYEPKQKN